MPENATKKSRRVLVVDDLKSMRSLVGQIVVENGHQIIEAEDGEDAILMANEFLPDLIVMDINMPRKTGVEALLELRQDIRFENTAIVMLTSDQDRNTIAEALKGGASDYIIKTNMAQLRQKLHPYMHLLNTSSEDQKSILVVDDTRLMRHLVSKVFFVGGHNVIEAENGKLGLAAAQKHNPNLIVMDVNMPVLGGIEALKILRKSQHLDHIPVIMLTSEQDVTKVKEIISLGVTDYIIKDNVSEIESRLTNYANIM